MSLGGIGNLQHVARVVDEIVVIGQIGDLELVDCDALLIASRSLELDQVILCFLIQALACIPLAVFIGIRIDQNKAVRTRGIDAAEVGRVQIGGVRYSLICCSLVVEQGELRTRERRAHVAALVLKHLDAENARCTAAAGVQRDVLLHRLGLTIDRGGIGDVERARLDDLGIVGDRHLRRVRYLEGERAAASVVGHTLRRSNLDGVVDKGQVV